MKKIIVPTDFSLNATKALDFAVRIAKQAKAKIILVHACDLLELTFKDYAALKKEFNLKVIKEANEKLALYKKSIEATEKLVVQIKLYEGLVTDTILHAAKIHKADMIIMGTLGTAGTREKIFGSKTAGVIGKSTIPVLAVPLLSEWKPPENILLAINNFKEGTKDIVNPVFELSALFKSAVHIATVTDAGKTKPVDFLPNQRALNAYTKQLQGQYKKTVITAAGLDGQQFGKTIEKYITAHNIDMVAMVTHRHSFVKSIFKRSMTKKMSYHTSIPLLAIPALRSE